MEAPARALIERLALAPHPEGGWYRETWRDVAGRDVAGRDAGAGGTRGHASLILFLLGQGERSHWHRIDATELWLFHGGAPLLLSLAPREGAAIETIRLTADAPQAIVPAGVWQAAESEGGYSLVGCAVAPAFDFAGFTLAPPGWAP